MARPSITALSTWAWRSSVRSRVSYLTWICMPFGPIGVLVRHHMGSLLFAKREFDRGLGGGDPHRVHHPIGGTPVPPRNASPKRPPTRQRFPIFFHRRFRVARWCLGRPK